MEKFTKDSDYNVMKEVAKDLKINPVGKKKEVLAEELNTAVAKQEKENKEPAKKWYEEEGACEFEPGDIGEVCNREFLEGRRFRVKEISRRKGYVRGYMLDAKTGEEQKTLGSYHVNESKKISKEQLEQEAQQVENKNESEEQAAV